LESSEKLMYSKIVKDKSSHFPIKNQTQAVQPEAVISLIYFINEYMYLGHPK
jgi:hypothetical protein